MSRVKRQHYVPQFYLQAFVKQDHVYVFDKTTQRVFPSAVQKAACETYFYDIPEVDKEVGIGQFLEKFFQPAEGAAAAALGSVLARHADGKLEAVSDEEREVLALHFALQYLRTREAREQQVQMYTKLMELQFRGFLEASGSDLAREEFELEADPKIHAAIHAMLLLDADAIQEIAWIMFRHVWILTPNPTGDCLITSDHPVVKQSHEKHPIFSMSGIGSVGIEIAIPLSPSLLLIMMDRVRYGDALGAVDGQVSHALSSQNVLFYNSLQVRDSARFLYSPADGFALAEEMCAAHPELRDPERVRVEMDSPWTGSSVAKED